MLLLRRSLYFELIAARPDASGDPSKSSNKSILLSHAHLCAPLLEWVYLLATLVNFSNDRRQTYLSSRGELALMVLLSQINVLLLHSSAGKEDVPSASGNSQQPCASLLTKIRNHDWSIGLLPCHNCCYQRCQGHGNGLHTLDGFRSLRGLAKVTFVLLIFFELAYHRHLST